MTNKNSRDDNIQVDIPTPVCSNFMKDVYLSSNGRHKIVYMCIICHTVSTNFTCKENFCNNILLCIATATDKQLTVVPSSGIMIIHKAHIKAVAVCIAHTKAVTVCTPLNLPWLNAH